MNDIDILEKLMEDGKEDFTDTRLSDYEIQAISTLISENKELKEINFRMAYNTIKNEEIKLDNYIEKSKVEEKIKELEQNVIDYEEYWSKDPRKFKREKCIDYYKIEVLQELLKENNND